MINLFDYTDFTEYLSHYCKDAKLASTNFSFRSFAEKAGLGNRWALYRILQKKTRLSMTHCAGLSKALLHTKKEAEYFRCIVANTRLPDVKESPKLFQKLMDSRRTIPSEPQSIGKNRHDFYSRWYHSVIRAIVAMGAFKKDYVSLGSILMPPITKTQAKRSIELLEQLDLIKKDRRGKYRIATAKSIKTGAEFTQKEKNRFHHEFMEIAQQLLFVDSSAPQKVSSHILGISGATYETICEETDKLNKRILALVKNDTGADQVFLYQSALIPLTKKTTGKLLEVSHL